MANFELRFLCGSRDGSFLTTNCFNEPDEDGIITVRTVCGETGTAISVILDKSTAIKFAKTLRTEINKIQEGGSNG